MKMNNKPLTLEELRSMANKPYWHVGLREDSGAPHWSILDPLLAYHPQDYDYGKTWLAYAYETPRLDRSAWEPCGCCKEKRCPTCKYDDCIPIFDPCNSCVDGSGWKPVYKFCPECGRPMTDAAWEVLEKRLEINE